MKITSPIPFLFPKNITQPVPAYKRINLHNMVIMGGIMGSCIRIKVRI